MRPYLLSMFLGAACSAPPTAPPGEPAPAPATPFDEPRPDASAAERPPTPEEIAAATQPEPPPTEADLAAAQDTPPPAPAPEPTPTPGPSADGDLTDVAAWPEGPATAPYSGWTRRPGVPLRGLGGDLLATLEKAGVRVEVLAQDGDRLSVQCIGCPAPWANAGGWMPADAVQPMRRALDPGSPLAALLPERVAWGRDRGSVPAGLDQRALCRLADQGYTEEGPVATWRGDGSVLTATRAEGGAWRLDVSGGPTAAVGAWRCPLTPPAG